jgi:hypothetical protein
MKEAGSSRLMLKLVGIYVKELNSLNALELETMNNIADLQP